MNLGDEEMQCFEWWLEDDEGAKANELMRMEGSKREEERRLISSVKKGPIMGLMLIKLMMVVVVLLSVLVLEDHIWYNDGQAEAFQ